MAEPANPPAPDDTKPNGDTGDKKFDQSQVDDIVAKRLNEERSKSEKLIADKIAEAQAEAERKAKLSADERAEEDRKKREESNSKREHELALRENRIEARELLQSKNISSDLVDFVVDVDLEQTKANIGTLEKAFTKAVEAGVKEKLKGNTPEDYSGTGEKPRGEKPKASGTIAF